ncbi:MAG: hypothetical protein ACK456_02625 [Pseudanabaenaceae cyanobacterium]
MDFLYDSYHCLKEGGTMRFAVPDFALWCNNYISGKMEFFNWYREAYLSSTTYLLFR